MTSIESLHARVAVELERMNDIIRSTLATTNPLMNRVVSTYLNTHGKQLRPMLVILSARFFGNVNPATLQAGAALEMLHNASLIHDDVVDETQLRRGAPTVNATWGNHMAVLVGDFFVSNALSAGIATDNLRVIAALSALGKELSLGEVDQICNAREHHFDEESYVEMIRQKTASLFLNCVKLGADTAGADPEEARPLVEFAALLGLAFQIKDDIFDYISSENKIGKPTGNDLREGKVTLPLLYALANAPDQEEAENFRNILRRGIPSDHEITRLLDFAIQNGGIDYAFKYMENLRSKGFKLLDSYTPTRNTDDFRLLFDYVIDRNR